MSAELLVAVVGLALLDAFNPATILAVALILLLPGERRAAKATTFIAGAYLTVLVLGATLFLAADTAAATAAGGLVWVRRIAFGLAALAVLRAAIRRLRRHRRAPIALPSWFTTTTAAPFGVLVTGADLPNAFPYSSRSSGWPPALSRRRPRCWYSPATHCSTACPACSCW